MKGFTLLEVLLALAIFTIIGIATAKHLQQIQSTKEIAFRSNETYNALRSAVSIMRTDFSQAFHILVPDLGPEAEQLFLAGRDFAHTIFDGRKQEIVFTSLSHRVYYAGRRESEQTEISYFLLKPQGSDLQRLMKRESLIIDENLFEGGNIYTILEGVEDLQFQYWDSKTERWIDDWSSDQGNFKDQFPTSIKMELTARGQDQASIKVATQFKISFPNNESSLVKF